MAGPRKRGNITSEIMENWVACPTRKRSGRVTRERAEEEDGGKRRKKGNKRSCCAPDCSSSCCASILELPMP